MVSTYQRPTRLLALLQDITREAGAARLTVQVLIQDDGSTLDYREALSRLNVQGWLYASQTHQGRAGYWAIVTALWQRAKAIDAQFYIMVPDDIRLTPGFFPEIIRQWHLIDHPDKLCLDPLLDLARLKYCAPRTEYHGGEKFFRVMWNDCCFFGPRKLMDVLEWTCHDPERAFQPGLNGSGVGAVITQKIIKAGGRMYRCSRSLVTHGAHQSRMHPTRQDFGGAITSERIVAGMATYSSEERLKGLPKVLKSIVKQVNELHIYWNGEGRAPKWLSTEWDNVIVHNADGKGEDLADMGKMCAIPQDSYFVTIDDDLVLPEHFVAKLLIGVEAYNRQAIVGYHGVTLRRWPVEKSYYKERIVQHNQAELKNDRAVHILGTCAVAFHTSVLHQPIMEPLENGIYMADLWLGRVAQEQRIPMVCLKHPAKVFEILPCQDTIFSAYYRRDTRQAEYVNAKPWELLPLPQRMEEE